jgi:hypothetical protein
MAVSRETAYAPSLAAPMAARPAMTLSHPLHADVRFEQGQGDGYLQLRFVLRNAGELEVAR